MGLKFRIEDDLVANPTRLVILSGMGTEEESRGRHAFRKISDFL
jgi:hypothetical protein